MEFPGSYLTGNQLNSASGTAVIRYSLERGCRVIELDTYDPAGGFKAPICTHGGTLTQPILFKVTHDDCIRVCVRGCGGFGGEREIVSWYCDVFC
jgi:hypothetical protein